MVRINTSVNGSSLIQKLRCAVRRGWATLGTLDGAGVRVSVCAGHRFNSAANGTGRLPRFRSKPLNRPVVSENCVTKTQALRLFAHRERALPSYMNVIGFGPRM